MKTIFLYLILNGFFLNLMYAQDVNTNNAKRPDDGTSNAKASWNELILGVPKVNQKNLFIMTDAIANTKGMEYVTYCPVHNLILLRYDASTYAKNDDILNVFKQKNIIMPMFIKQGKFEEIKDLCNQ